jgi:hypothetical protein
MFNSGIGCVYTNQLCCYEVKLPNLKLKIWPKQLLDSLPLDIVMPVRVENQIVTGPYRKI